MAGVKIYASFSIFGPAGCISQVAGDIDLPELPKVGDQVDIRFGILGLMASAMPAALDVADVVLVEQPDGTATQMVLFEYFDVGSTEARFEICRLLESELGFWDQLHPFDDPEDEPEG